jgi:uncharacterized protein YndB with AHSA1/START domain
VRLVSSARTSASPAQVWEVLGDPARWPEFELFLRRVRGARGAAAAGQTLVGVSRLGSLGIPIDVLEAVPGRRLVLRVHTAPGVRETVTHEVLPVLSGGSDVRVSVVVDGLLARVSVVPLWLASALTTRLLVVRTDRIARAARRAA